MLSLTGQNVVVVGGSRGVGRRIVEATSRAGARVLAVARGEESLLQLVKQIPGVEALSIDATDDSAPPKVFDTLQPNLLVLTAGSFPPAAPLHELSWKEFGRNWETDTRIAFQFCKAALLRPLPTGTSIILISSGAALAGSPISGGYAGAKRTQIFIANYAQKESDRLGLGLRFTTLAPRMMPDTALGSYAVDGYSRYLKIPPEDFIKSMDSPPTASDVATAAIEIGTQSNRPKGNLFIVSGRGLEPVS